MKKTLNILVLFAIILGITACSPKNIYKPNNSSKYYDEYDRMKIVESNKKHKIISEPSAAKVLCEKPEAKEYISKVDKNQKLSSKVIKTYFKECGVTPFQTSYTDKAVYVLSKKGYLNEVLWFDNRNESKSVKLEKQYDGYVKLYSNIKNTKIFINQEYVGKISERPLVKKLLSGDYYITAKADKYATQTIRLSVQNKKVEAHIFNMQKADGMTEVFSESSKISYGSLVIGTKRNDLNMILDGVNTILPVELHNIATGQFKATIYNTKKKITIDINIKDSEKTFIDIDELF